MLIWCHNSVVIILSMTTMNRKCHHAECLILDSNALMTINLTRLSTSLVSVTTSIIVASNVGKFWQRSYFISKEMPKCMMVCRVFIQIPCTTMRVVFDRVTMGCMGGSGA